MLGTETLKFKDGLIVSQEVANKAIIAALEGICGELPEEACRRDVIRAILSLSESQLDMQAMTFKFNK